MKKKGVVFLFFIALFSFSLLRAEVITEKHETFFVQVPIEKFSSGIPCVFVEIENQKLLMEIDLGFQGNLNLPTDLIDRIQNKSSLPKKLMYGFRGSEYEVSRYLAPPVKIGEIKLSDLILHEMSLEQCMDEALVKSKNVHDSFGSGNLGWPTFYHSNFFLDCKNKRVAFCDSVETLKAEGISIEKFIKTSLSLKNGILEFMVDTGKGPLRCFLDTGSTLNLVNGEIEGDASMEEWVIDQKSHFEMTSFKIEGKEFGPQPFCTLPMKFPVHIEAAVGMEFLQDHVVFIDFKNRHIYFAPSEELEDSSQVFSESL